jgi:hypothetical protein
MGAFYRQKGVEHALDHMCDSLDFVVVGIYWPCGWWTDSYPAGHRHRRGTDPSYSGAKVKVAIWTLAGGGEVFGGGQQVQKDFAESFAIFSRKGLAMNHFTTDFIERRNHDEREEYRYPLFSASYADRHLCSLCIDTHTGKYR